MDTNQAICPEIKDDCNIPPEVCSFLIRCKKMPVRQCHDVVIVRGTDCSERNSLHLLLYYLG